MKEKKCGRCGKLIKEINEDVDIECDLECNVCESLCYVEVEE